MQSLCPWGHGWSHSTQAWRVSDGELRQGTGWSLPFQALSPLQKWTGDRLPCLTLRLTPRSSSTWRC